MRDWTTRHFDFTGYVTGPAAPDRERLRHDRGYRPGERVCVVAVGGSGVGGHLLRRVASAYPEVARRVPALRMIVVCGAEVRGYVPVLHHEFAACDIAVVQGGLTTTTELVAAGRPFLCFPLAHHFEQQVHVPHRLAQYRAGRRMDYATATPEVIADAIATDLDRPVDSLPVESGGARRAAGLLAELLRGRRRALSHSVQASHPPQPVRPARRCARAAGQGRS